MTRPARPRGRPPRATGPSGRERLVASARVEFARHGLAGASIEALAHAAGVGAPTLYHHFGGKTRLFTAVAEDVYRQVIDHFEAATAGAASFEAAVDAVLRSSVPIMRADPGLSAMIVVVQAELRRDPSLAEALRPVLRRFRRFFDGLAGSAPVTLCPDEASRRHVALALIAMITGLNTQAPLLHEPDDFEAVVTALRRLVLPVGPSSASAGNPRDAR